MPLTPDYVGLVRSARAFPLWSALFGRRSRRFGLGMEIPSGPLAFASTRAALPLTPLERALLTWAAAGVSGYNTGIPHTTAGAKDAGCNYPLRLTGRTYASGAGIHSSELIVSDDAGTYVTRFRDLDPSEGQWNWHTEAGLERFVSYVSEHMIRIDKERVSIPNAQPHLGGHNAWSFNRPGSTLFIPVIDLAEHALNLLPIYLGSACLPFDNLRNRPAGKLEPFVREGLLDPERRLPLADFEQHVLASAAMEAAQMGHNLMLTLQALGLGGWMFAGVNPLSLMGAFASSGVRGLGFRFQRDPRWSSPNPVGIDGAFEAAGPPYVPTMRAAVARLNAHKFGDGGTFDPKRPGPFADNAEVKRRIARYSPAMLAMTSAVAEYVLSEYGRFPGTVPTIYLRPCIQVHHLDTEYYDRHFCRGAYLETHARHLHDWHGEPASHDARARARTCGAALARADVDASAMLDRLETQIDRSYANRSLIYALLAESASLGELIQFLRWDAAQPAYASYLRRWLPKAPPMVRAPLERHIAIEEGERHSDLFRAMMAHLDPYLPKKTTTNAAVLERLNYTFSQPSADQDDIGFFLGGFWATEIMSARRCGQLRRGLARHGIAGAPVEYLRIHDDNDTMHGEEVRRDFIVPLVAHEPTMLPSVVRGVHDRLTRSSEYLMWYEANEMTSSWAEAS